MMYRLPSPIRPAVCVLAVLVYVLPGTLSVVSVLTHNTYHWVNETVVAEAVKQRRLAAALGLGHVGDKAPAQAGRQLPVLADTEPSGRFTHTHDGTTHAHNGLVDGLLVADDADADRLAPAAVIPLGITAHLPEGTVRLLLVPTEVEAGPTPPPLALLSTTEGPPLRPPRV